MGLSSKKTKTESKAETVATPTNPEWVESPFKDFFASVTKAGQADPASYIAPTSKLQTTAFDRLLAMPTSGGNGAEAMAKAGAADVGGYDPSLTGPAAHGKAASLLDNLDAYYNPARKELVDATLADFDEGAGRTRAAQLLDGAKNSALGGSGFAIREGVTEGELARARTTADAQLRYDAFDRATGLSDADANRRQQMEMTNVGADNTFTLSNQGSVNDAGRFNVGVNQDNATRKLQGASLLDQLAGSDRDSISLMAQLGGTQRDIDAQTRLAPLSLLEALGGLYGLGQPGLFRGQTTKQTGSGTSVTTDPMGTISSLLQAGGAMASGLGAMGVSDERLKREIETVGFDEAGRRWVDFSYVWDAPDQPRRRGVLAQEIAQSDPAAVFMHPGGFLMVDYSQLGAGV